MFIALLFMTLALFGAFIPALAARRVQEQKILHERYRCHQLRWVRKNHPELQKLNYREILRRYDLDHLYSQISVRSDPR